MKRTRRLAQAAVWTFAACGAPGADGPPTFGGATGPGDDETGSSTAPGPEPGSSTASSTAAGSSDASTSAAASSTSTGDAVPPDFGGPTPLGCNGKIDFLFMISNDEGMAGHQEQLQVALPAFLQQIEASFADWDTHIMVVDGQEDLAFSQCAGCFDECEGGPPGYPCQELGALNDPCAEVKGAGLVFPVGWGATNHACDLWGGQRYIQKGDPDPLAAFRCIATVGIGGASKPAEMVWYAVTQGINGPGGCNEGFVREDALLVVTIINDGFDEAAGGSPSNMSEGYPALWASSLVSIKGGDPDAVVLLVITTDVDRPDGLCHPDGWPTGENRLRTFYEAMLPNSLLGSICQPTWSPFFAQATDMVLELCDAYVPL